LLYGRPLSPVPTFVRSSSAPRQFLGNSEIGPPLESRARVYPVDLDTVGDHQAERAILATADRFPVPRIQATPREAGLGRGGESHGIVGASGLRFLLSPRGTLCVAAVQLGYAPAQA